CTAAMISGRRKFIFRGAGGASVAIPKHCTISPGRVQRERAFEHALTLNLQGQTFTLALMRFAICNEIFKGWNIEETISYVAKVGYDAIEIAPFTLADSVTQISSERRQQIRQAAADKGISISGIHWVL